MGARANRCLAVTFAVVAVEVALPVTAFAGRTVEARTIVRTLSDGGRFIGEDATIAGPLDLGRLDTVKGVLECHACDFKGKVSAHDVVFDRTIDLSGSTFERGVDFEGATFQAPVLFRVARVAPRNRRACMTLSPGPNTRSACFKGDADFSLAVFDDVASFTRAGFEGEAAFDGAAFRGDAIFGGTHFVGPSSLAEVVFRARSEFAQAEFHDGASFAGAQFVSGASFLAAQFASDTTGEAVTFQSATASADVNLTFALFSGDEPTASFDDFVGAGALVLRGLELPQGLSLGMDRLQVRDLDMDLSLVRFVSCTEGTELNGCDQETTLKMIEQSAKARGDLQQANDAHWALQVMKSKHYSKGYRLADYVVYREIAGYLVRPLHPLVTLLVLGLLFGVIRAGRRQYISRKPLPSDRWAARHMSRRAGNVVHNLFTSFLDTFALLAPRRGSDAAARPLLQRLEAFGYRLLLVCALIALANSNPTLRQMVDTLF